MKIKYLEINNDTSEKFWAIILNEDLQFIKFGEIGTSGTEEVKKFNSIEESQSSFDNLIKEKIKKGYKETDFSENQNVVVDRINVVFEVQQNLKKFKLDRFLGKLELYSGKGIKIKTIKPDDYKNIGNSRIGGMPDLPKNMEWPETVYNQYFNFLCQINLNDIAHLNFNLPKEGILYFFMGEDAGIEEDNRIIYYSGDINKLEKYNIKKLSDKGFADGEADYMKRPYILKFEEIISMANIVDLPREWGIQDDEYENYTEMTELLEKNEERNIHYMFNFPFYQCNNPRDMENKFADKDFHNKGICLLSLKYDSNVDFCFGDAGDLNFVISKNDLEKLNFENIYCSIESS